MQLSGTSYVVLGMLSLGRRTGYEIKSLVDVSTRFFWAASYGQIYPELKRLERAGLVRGERDPGDARRRKQYELTPAGREALHSWLAAEEPPRTELRHEGTLKFFFADALEPDEQRALLARIAAHHQEIGQRIGAVSANKAAQAERENGVRCPLLTAEFGVAYHDFIAGWCRETARRLEEES